MSAARPKLPFRRVYSAGGVIQRTDGERVEVVICGQKERGIWALPKGSPRAGESTEQTALREVEEETGLKVEVAGKIGKVQYWFVEEGTRFFKTVYYYLMTPVGGDTADHDPEFDEIRWCGLGEALNLLTYKTDADIVRQAAEMVRGKGEQADGAV